MTPTDNLQENENSPENNQRLEPLDAEDKTAQELKPEEGSSQALQDDLDRFRDLALRTQADFDNFRKRAAREREEGMRYANVSLIEKIIPILDNFELGLDAARQDSDGGAIVSGLEMVGRQLQDLLSSQGVETLDALGQPFDPKIHDALGQEASDEVEEGIVLRQLRKGYRLKERLVRPANVIVSKGAAQEG